MKYNNIERQRKTIMPDYTKGKVYCIRSYQTDDIYIGSTTQALSMRIGGHRANYKLYLNNKYNYVTSFEIIQYDDCYIELIELCSCLSKEELCKREGEHIRLMHCVNKYIAGRTIKQYREDNKDELKEYIKQYREEHKNELKQYRESNKDEIAERSKKYYEDNKDEIKKKKKQYREEHKNELKQYYEDNKDKRKQYYEDNKDEIKDKQKEYREEHKYERKKYLEEHKDEIAEKNKQYYEEHKNRYICEICNYNTYSKKDYTRHKNSIKHKNNIEII